jgi:catalase
MHLQAPSFVLRAEKDDDKSMHSNDPAPLSLAAALARLAAIGLIMFGAAVLFCYTAGWLTPAQITQDRFIGALQANDGVHPGFRRNHAKGVCVTGWYEPTAAAAALSEATVFHSPRVPFIGRFALAGGMPFGADDPTTVRSFALRFMPAGGQEWRTGMNDIPVFVAKSAQGFYDMTVATHPDPVTHKPDPATFQAFLAEHPETAQALTLVKARAISSGFADDTFNSLNAFIMVAEGGATQAVRWAAVPLQPFTANDPGAPASDPNYLFDALVATVHERALQWRLVFTLAEPGDPTHDATLPWPAERRKVEAGTLHVERAVSEDEGACTDVTYDPLVLPTGIRPSDDPILAARSSVYARSFALRTGEKREKPPSALSPQVVHGATP